MVEGLAARGELDERWRAAFTEVPRQEFIPDLVWHHDRDAGSHCDLVPCAVAMTSRAGWSGPTPTHR
jgi:protein-L-isoaspartate O-methyltransferase